jgi:hypothetical protein
MTQIRHTYTMTQVCQETRHHMLYHTRKHSLDASLLIDQDRRDSFAHRRGGSGDREREREMQGQREGGGETERETERERDVEEGERDVEGGGLRA